MFEIVSLSKSGRAAAVGRGMSDRRRASWAVAASVAVSTLFGASSAAAAPVVATDPDASDAAAPAASVSDRVLRNDLLAWSAWKVDEATKAAIAAAQRPDSVAPAVGLLSSLFGPRWGSMHNGVDIAAPIGTPVAAVVDGTVIEAGPASGFGLWVRVAHDDGTVSVYGHVDTILSAVGQRVRAGDVIATVGNRGQSTGPHLHLEIWLPGGEKIDPLGWLLARGVDLARQPAA